MKNPAEWLEEDLLNLINTGAEESLNLEFKGSSALGDPKSPKTIEHSKTEVSKDVSSFANSVGGTVVYGIDENPKPPHKAVALSPIDPLQFSKEWLEQVINSRIHPRIQGLLIRPVELTGINSTKVAYVVVVPQSSTAHQAHDKRYYRRFNFQSVPMEDYEIRQAMNRTKWPTYDVQVFPIRARESGKSVFQFRANLINTAGIVSHDVSVVLLIPSDLSFNPPERFATEDFKGIQFLRVPGDRYITLPPQVLARIDFLSNPLVIPDILPSRDFPVNLRVFDSVGLAVEAEYEVRFTDGRIISQNIKGRESLY